MLFGLDPESVTVFPEHLGNVRVAADAFWIVDLAVAVNHCASHFYDLADRGRTFVFDCGPDILLGHLIAITDKFSDNH